MKKFITNEAIYQFLKRKTNLAFSSEAIELLSKQLNLTVEEILTDILYDLEELAKICNTKQIEKRHVEYVMTQYIEIEEE
ncbi:MAG: hypothetical protein ACP6IU_02975 [Candidatus Asgardarchaeia archaeon]